jgi:hypothetical protein
MSKKSQGRSLPQCGKRRQRCFIGESAARTPSPLIDAAALGAKVRQIARELGDS